MNLLRMFFRNLFLLEEGGAGGGSGGGAGGGAGGGDGGAGGGAGDAWFKGLPDDAVVTVNDQGTEKQIKLKEHPSVGKFKTTADIAKSYVELEQHKGKLESQISKSVVIPGKDAKPEEREAFYNRLGRPEKAEGYKLEDVQGLHQAIKVTPESSKGFFDAAHKLGITQGQANELNKWFLGTLSQSLSAQDKANQDLADKTKNELVQEWGKDYDKNMTMAKRFVEQMGGQEAVNAIGDLGSNPVMLKIFAKAAQSMSEDTVSNLGFNSLNMSPAQAKQKIAEQKDDPKSAYNNENDSKHGQAVTEMRELYKVAYPDQK